MDDRIYAIVQRHLAGESASVIAKDIGMSRARVYQLIKDAHMSGEISVHVQIADVRGADRDHIARILRKALAAHGVSTHRSDPET